MRSQGQWWPIQRGVLPHKEILLFTLKDVLTWAEGVARGLEYLPSIHEALGSVFGTTYNRCGGVCLSPACWRQRQGDHKSEVIFSSTASSRPAQVIGDPVSNKTKGRKRALPTVLEKRAVGNSDGAVAQTPSHTQCRGWGGQRLDIC